ncbi:MAG TPA: Hsp20/alpha crystallin family protein [Thermoanaerobaculia bacterium]|jgi:HSP20 family protein|nr:Hsp20/alpha crystallin family protein [Thermoanaerobaculia bacterium]
MADETNTNASAQAQTGTATLTPEHHQTQAAAGSPQAGTAPGGQTATAATTAATSTPGSNTTGSTSPGSASAGSSTSPWSPGSSASASASSPGLSRREPSFSSPGALGLWNPLALIDQFFDDFLGYGSGRGRGSNLSSGSRDLGRTTGQSLWYPQVEVRERDGKLVVCADLPGTRKEDVHVEVRDKALILEGERRQESEQSQEGFYRSERSYGRFHRTIPLPEGVNPEQAQANFKDGVLEITLPLPQRQSSQGRRIEIT